MSVRMAILVNIAQIKEFISSYPRISWTLGVFLIVSIVCGIIVSFASPCTKYFFGMKFGPDNPCLGEDNAKRYYGYLHTLNHAGDTVCVEELLDLEFHPDGQIEGEIKGNPHTASGGREPRTWDTFGYRHGSEISLVYRTTGQPRSGHGVYFLMGRGVDKVGYWLGTDFPNGENVRCRYVLTDRQKDAGRCEENWPDVFSNQSCEILFDPNR